MSRNLSKLSGTVLATLLMVGAPAHAQTLAMLDLPVSTSERVQHSARTVSVSVTDTDLETVLRSVAQQARMELSFVRSDVDLSAKTTVALSNVPVERALETILRKYPIEARIASDGETIVLRAKAVKAVDGVITGKVIHAKTRQPVAGATVMLGADTKGIVTGSDGTFRIPASAGEHTLSVRAVGFVREQQKVTVTAEQTITVEIVLEPSASVLNEVVVTGTVVATERKAIATPITVVTAADIEKRGITRIEQLFRGEIPGVIALDQGAEGYDPNTVGGMAGVSVFVRGSSSLPETGTSDAGRPSKSNPLKTYVDGIEIQDAAYLGTIDPQSIERIEIITGPQAATLYGSGAMGGVMQIFTKKGTGAGTPEVVTNIKYGILQNNVSNSKAPLHNDAITITGGSGPGFTYSGTLSYNYTGQWTPGVYNRRFGASVGATHTRGDFIASATAVLTTGKNGTSSSGWPLMFRSWNAEGWYSAPRAILTSPIHGLNASQTLGVNFSYRQNDFIQHQMTAGRSSNDFEIIPEAPLRATAGDSLYRYRNTHGVRTTASYNANILVPAFGPVTQTMAIGFNGAVNKTSRFVGDAARQVETTLTPTSAGRTNDKSWGGFGTWRVGFFEQLYLTLGLRGEHNPNYGNAHKLDWTPNLGAAYTIDLGDLTMKLLGSYGRATRPPLPDYKLDAFVTTTSYSPSSYQGQFANPDLTPEYSRGPQGGIEVYYGSLMAITVNRYRQRTTDLLQRVAVDSVLLTLVSSGADRYLDQYQWQNTAVINQDGWEAMASVNLADFMLKGTYSWTESRVASVSPNASGNFYPGQSFLRLPSHMGNITAGYASGALNVNLVTSFVGQSLQDGRSNIYYWITTGSRVSTYNEIVRRRAIVQWAQARKGYVKSDLIVTQRVNNWLTGTLNIMNLGNSYGSESIIYNPTLGRQTLFGLSMRYPRR